jgi:uncharacterized lipoprotein YmbA
MMMHWRIPALLILLALFIPLAACSSSKVSFYTLSAAAGFEEVKPVNCSCSVNIGPVSLPEIVDRTQLVVQLKGNQVDILEFHRWAEPLKSQIPRLMADNVGRLIGSGRVSAYPQSIGSDANIRVPVDIQRFEVEGEMVRIDAFWTLRRGLGEVAKTGRSSVSEKVEGTGYDALAAAYSRALFSISIDIANALREELSRPQ